MAAGELQVEWYKSINPNGKVPAIVHVKEDGTSVTVFESAACLLYVASELDRDHKISYPVGTPEYWKQLSWVCLLVALPHPGQVQTNVLYRVAFVAGCGIRPHDGPGSVLQPVRGRASALQHLALHGGVSTAQPRVGHAAGECLTPHQGPGNSDRFEFMCVETCVDGLN